MTSPLSLPPDDEPAVSKIWDKNNILTLDHFVTGLLKEHISLITHLNIAMWNNNDKFTDDSYKK